MKVTEKNMFTVMGHINAFFKKDTCRYIGIKNHQVGSKTVTYEDFSYEQPIYEARKTYVPYIGSCQVHHIRKRIIKKQKNGEKLFMSDIDSKNVLLAICDKYSNCCIPIKEGFDVSIKGNMMVIKENDVYSISHSFSGKKTYFRMKEKSTYEYFYHMPISDEERLEASRNGIYNMHEVADQGYFMEDFYDMHNEMYADAAREMHGDITRQLFNKFDKIDMNCSEVDLKIYFYDSDFEGDYFLTHINVEAIRNGLDKCNENAYYFAYDGEKFYDLLALINYYYYKNFHQDDCCEEEEDFDFDFDYFE